LRPQDPHGHCRRQARLRGPALRPKGQSQEAGLLPRWEICPDDEAFRHGAHDGYHVGGISPFGQKKRVPTLLEQSALDHREVYVNGGQRGLQVRLDPHDAASALAAKSAVLI
jgi:hypothetical protein